MVDKAKLDQVAFRADNLIARFDTFMTKRRMKADADRKRMADARIAKDSKRLDSIKRPDDFAEAHHPRNANGVFTPGEGEEAKEKEDTQLNPGLLSKKDPL
jgi:hypothetical protein